MKIVTTALTCIGLLLSIHSYSQEAPALGSLPMLYNGGFAGESGNGRLSLGARGLGTFLGNRYGVYASYDHFFSKISTGVGFTGIAGDGGAYILSISPKISFKGKYTLAPFVDLIAVHEDLSGRAGILFNAQKFYFGYALNINYSPSYTIDYYSSLLQLGYTYQKLPESKFSFTPQLVIDVSDIFKLRFKLPDYSLMFRYSKFLAGFNRDGLALGYQGKKDKIVLSQNYIFFNAVDEPRINLSYRHFFMKKDRSVNSW